MNDLLPINLKKLLHPRTRYIDVNLEMDMRKFANFRLDEDSHVLGMDHVLFRIE